MTTSNVVWWNKNVKSMFPGKKSWERGCRLHLQRVKMGFPYDLKISD
jgi:hypothetical protein